MAKKPGRPKNSLKTETEFHKDVFEFYYLLGDSISLDARVQRTAEEFDKSRATIYQWKKVFKWDDRKKERDKKVRRKIERMTEQTIVERYMKYLDAIELSVDDYLKRALSGDMVKIEKSIDLERFIKLAIHVSSLIEGRDDKSESELQEEIRKKAEAYEDYFNELESEVGELQSNIEEETESEGKEDSGS